MDNWTSNLTARMPMRVVLGVVVLFLGLVPISSHAQKYSLTDLGTLGGLSLQYSSCIPVPGALPGQAYCGYGTIGTGINSAGQITGYSVTTSNAQHAFLYTPGRRGTNGTMIDIDTFGNGDSSVGMGINNNGQVTGWFAPTNTPPHAFVYTPGSGGAAGTMGDLGTSCSGHWSGGYGINDSGQVTGQADFPTNLSTDGPRYHAFVYTPGIAGSGACGSLVDLGAPSGTSIYDSIGQGINNSGQIAGFLDTCDYLHQLCIGASTRLAFVYSPSGSGAGSMIILPSLPATYQTLASSININGQVTGYAEIPGSPASNGFPVTPASSATFIYAPGEVVGPRTARI
jgi:probable HAF family extracellular repeat protein